MAEKKNETKKTKKKASPTTKELKKIAKEAEQKKKKLVTYSKFILLFVIINSELQIWASYVLAFLGKDAIAESLSEQVVIVIIGGLIPYFAKSLIENLSKNTTMFGQNLNMENVQNFIPNDSEDKEENLNDVEEEVEEPKDA